MNIVLGLVLLGLVLSIAGDLLEFVCQLVRGVVVYFVVRHEQAKENRRGNPEE